MQINTREKTSDLELPAQDVRAERVSVVIPCYNEERFIGKALGNLADQYQKDLYEIIVVDGLSEDRTRVVIEDFKRTRPELSIRVLDNPARKIPVALNLGVAAAQGEIIARMDAHAVPSKGYVRRCVAVLDESGAGVVGMPCRVQPATNSLMARAIAAAVSHPFGIGDAKYRLSESTLAQEPVDTVAFACFRKSLWQQLGGFDENLIANEDYDFNYRVRLQGQTVLLDRSEHCDYFARSTLKELASQYRRYGGWKARMLLMHPLSLKLRHLIAPAFVMSVISLGIAGIWWQPLWAVLALEVASYLCLGLFFGRQISIKIGGGLRMVAILPIVFLTIHCTWGMSFLIGLVRRPR